MEPFTGPAVNRSPCRRKKKKKHRKKGEACAHSSVELTGCEWQLVWKANREILLGLVAELFIQKQSFEELRHSAPKHAWRRVLEHGSTKVLPSTVRGSPWDQEVQVAVLFIRFMSPVQGRDRGSGSFAGSSTSHPATESEEEHTQ